MYCCCFSYQSTSREQGETEDDPAECYHCALEAAMTVEEREVSCDISNIFA
jgi:hypothetical protein